MINRAKELLKRALNDGVPFDYFADLLELKEIIAQLETQMARGKEAFELERAGASRGEAKRIERRADNYWREHVPVEHQDLILSAMEKLSRTSKRRCEIYDLAANAALKSSPRQTYEYVKQLVREENEALAQDPNEAYRQRRFTMRSQDEHGGCQFYGYAPAATAALMKALVDKAFRAAGDDDENRTIEQRNHDALHTVLEWASSDRVAATGHAALVVSVSETDEFDWRAKFATNVGVDLRLFEIANLGGDLITDYIVVHDHRGAVKSLVTGERCANFYQRVALTARDLVCQHPGCDEPATRCDAHHVRSWKQGGKTAVNNLALLCRRHHRRNDDSFLEEHLEMILGRPSWITSTGEITRNLSPAANKAGSRRIWPLT